MATEKAVSREYLEEALSVAKKNLPGWAYAMIYQQARAKAGGRISATRRQERKADDGARKDETEVVKEATAKARAEVQTLIFSKDNFAESQAVAWALEHDYTASKVDETPESFRIRQRPPTAFEDGSYRTIDITEGVQAVIGTPKEQSTATLKSLSGDGGVHAHALKRGLGATDMDGAHVHAFELPSGMLVSTVLDGEHSHTLEDEAGVTGMEASAHAHRVVLADGSALKTAEDGKHFHEALLKTTSRDGTHTHELELPSGEVIVSLTPAEYYERKRKRILLGDEVSEMMRPVDSLSVAEVGAQIEPAPGADMPPPAVAFIGSHDSALDRARREPLTGPVGAVFRTRYLKPLGIERDQALVMNINGNIEAVRKTLKEAKPRAVVALGRDARDALGDLADCMMPHPHVLTRRDDTGEVARKLRVVAKRLAVDSTAEYHPSIVVPIAKANDEKRIVYGVVLDPYAVDAHDEHVPPSVIEATAHEWLSSSRLIGVEHTQLAKAVPVESHLVHYPTALDRELAFTGQPHKAYQMRYGADVVHSGAWILGTKLGDAEWGAVKDGRINAYSIGGWSIKVPMTAEDMPQVEFIDLGG